MKHPSIRLSAGLLFLLQITCLAAQPAEDPEDPVVARIGDGVIRQSDLERAAASELVDLRMKRHSVLEEELQRQVADRVINLEAEAREISVAELVQTEVDQKVPAPTAEEIENFYQTNRSRLQPNMTKEQLLPQIAAYLSRQTRQRRYWDLVTELRDKFGVSTSLEPLRLDVEADGHPSKGPRDAPVTIVEFSDFECPYCSELNKTMDRILQTYGDRIRLVFRQFPLTSLHPNAMKAAQASLCAGEQDKFWQLHDAMFADQELGPDALRTKAEEIGLDVEAFQTCLASDRYARQVELDLAAGGAVGVTGTPALFVNGRPLKGAVTYEQLEQVIEEELER